MQIKQVTNEVWVIEGETITADSKEEAIRKYWIVRASI